MIGFVLKMKDLAALFNGSAMTGDENVPVPVSGGVQRSGLDPHPGRSEVSHQNAIARLTPTMAAVSPRPTTALRQFPNVLSMTTSPVSPTRHIAQYSSGVM